MPRQAVAELDVAEQMLPDSNEETATTSSQSSQQSIPEQEISIWSDEMEEQQEKRQTLNTAITSLTGGRTSPILSTLNTSWHDISSTQQKYYQRKAKETIIAALSVIGPGQEQDLWTDVRKDVRLESGGETTSRRKSFDPSSGIIDSLVKAYNQAESWQTKRQILSIFANDFSRAELMNLIPTLSKWRIDQARQHATEAGKGQSVPPEPIFRTRISRAQVEHFIGYISRPEMMQDVAFGTKVLKLDSGGTIIIPAVVRTMIPSRIIEQYQSYCVQQNFEPSGKRSLFRMIEVCAASVQKSLQGLDNTTAEGTEAIGNLADIVSTLSNHGLEEGWVKFAQQRIKEVKRYLKTEFKCHVGREESCTDHCVTYALNDPGNQQFQSRCQHVHDVQCSTCMSLEKIMDKTVAEINHVSMSEEQKSRLRHECMQNIESIKAWKAHLLRTVNQEEGKQDALATIEPETCLIVMDWAMKYLPQRYRERMSDFFGKRGRSWHVSAVITKRNGKLNVECFVHIFDTCTQNSFAVASIVEHLLNTIKQESPQIKNAYFRSDNAGCYHSGSLLLSLSGIGQRTGIAPVRYDFSDPQSGKDICDRKTAPMKAHIRRWVNEKHDVVTAEDMKNALESHGGVKGCRAAVVQVDPGRENTFSTNKIPGISLLNNFAFEENGIRAWRGYNIGPGKLLSYRELEVEPQGDTGLQVLHEFGPRLDDLGSISDAPVTRAEIFSCSENTCVLTFKTMAEAEAHMDTGKHVQASECESVYDTVRKRWAERVTEMNLVSGEALRIAVDEGPSTSSECNSPEGWALKTTRRAPRMVEKAKAFLIEKFNAGATGRQKSDPAQVAKEMKFAKDTRGNLLFQPEEWRTAQQISSFFSRLSALQRHKQAESDDDAVDEEDIVAMETEHYLQTVHQAVLEDMGSPSHPIKVNNFNICELLDAGKLSTLKVVQLRDVCSELKLQTPGSQSRKRTFIDPLEAFANTCSCRK